MIIINKQFKFKDYTFGFADSETEFSREPVIFKDAFYDPKNILDKLIHGNKFILIGNKGVGKTAFSAKIRSLALNTYDLQAEQISLSNFEFKTFTSTGLSHYEGGQKYKTIWDLTLTIEIYKFLYKNYDFSSIDEFNSVIEFLEKNKIIIKKNINNTVRKLSALEFGISEFFKFRGEATTENFSNFSIPELSEFMLDSLEPIYFNNFNNLIIIDGLDDILRYEKDQLDILSGLFRSINEINNFLYSNNIPIKIIILARTDILSSIVDPDFNKIKRDGGITLRWDNKTDDLKELVNLRFLLSGIKPSDIQKHWYTLFPRRIKTQNSWNHILEFTLNKPRDILQFLRQCQETFPNKTSLSYSDVDLILRDYSTEYFLEEMKNELSGFICDEAISNIHLILTKLGKTDFTFDTFKDVTSSILPSKNDEFFKTFIAILFENGYVGQVVVTKTYDKTLRKNVMRRNAIFKHKMPTSTLDLNNRLVIHKGLYKALNFSTQ